MELTAVTWNTCTSSDCDFVVQAAQRADVLCLQEVTALSAQTLAGKLGETFHVVTPETAGASFSTEGLGTALLARKKLFALEAVKVTKFEATEQERSLMTVRLRAADTGMSLLVATAHLESGAESVLLRREQLNEVRAVLRDDTVDAALFAGDLNLRYEEQKFTQGLGDDVWCLAGEPKHDEWTWYPPLDGDMAEAMWSSAKAHPHG